MKIIKITNFLLTESLSESEELDRISDLPDEILQLILSFVEPHHAVRTSVLSKRWKNLWISMPKLNFYFSPYINPDCHRSHDSRNPRIVNFPDRLLISETLRELILTCSARILLPRPFVLPNLKVLSLDGFSFDCDCGGKYQYNILPREPFSGFSNLEKLTNLYGCLQVDNLIISAPKLKILELVYLNNLNRNSDCETKVEEISARGLTSLVYVGCSTLACKKVDCPSLEEIYFDMWATFGGGPSGKLREDKKMAPKLIKMLQRFGNYAKFSTFTLRTTQVLAADPCLLDQSPSPFPYLKRLKFNRVFYESKRMEIVAPIVMNYLTKGSSYDVSSSYDDSCDV